MPHAKRSGGLRFVIRVLLNVATLGIYPFAFELLKSFVTRESGKSERANDVMGIDTDVPVATPKKKRKSYKELKLEEKQKKAAGKGYTTRQHANPFLLFDTKNSTYELNCGHKILAHGRDLTGKLVLCDVCKERRTVVRVLTWFS